jgi:3-hydroxyacyl-CoA dehydrogenase
MNKKGLKALFLFFSRQYLLNLEREAFLSFCGEKKPLQGLQSVLKGGKPLRN